MPSDQDFDRDALDEAEPTVPSAPGDDLDELIERRRPLWARIGIAILAVSVTLFIFPVIAKMFVPPINPLQAAPPSHVSLDCGTCHNISADVSLKSVR
jgi:hypothetical protein